MKVTIGIPTYNRRDLLECMANSLYASDLSDCCNIRIYDDCSFDYSRNDLQKLFPNAASVTVNSYNYKADKNMFSMYQDFISTGDDYFFNADSDIIFNTNWLTNSLDFIKQTDGVLSIFNANSHQIQETINANLNIKTALGAAGTFFTREKVVDIVSHFNSTKYFDSFDWQWSKYLVSQGVRLFCVNKSLVQHIGYDGQNSKFYFDVGTGFTVNTLRNGQIINDVMVASVSGLRQTEIERSIKIEEAHSKLANDFSYHFKRCVIIIIKTFLPHTWISYFKNKFR